MSTSAAATRPVRSIRPPGLKRLLARICGCEESEFVLQVVQPSLVGMIDGTVSTLAPIFAAAVSSSSRTVLLVGLATALGAGVSMVTLRSSPSRSGGRWRVRRCLRIR